MKKNVKQLGLALMVMLFLFGAFSMKTYAAELTYDNFDYVAYADDYPDLKAAYGYDKDQLYNHYINNGKNEGRVAKTLDGSTVSDNTGTTVTGDPSKLTLTAERQQFIPINIFDADFYAEHNPDVAAAFGNNKKKLYSHYVNNGVKEGRACYTTDTNTNAVLLLYDLLPTVCNDGMTDEQKVRAFHDFLANYCQYDYANYLNGSIPWRSYHPTGVMLYNTAVCQGYAETFDVAMGLLGIDCTICTGLAFNGSSTGNHAWNCVKLYNQDFYVDVTWDDPISNVPMVRYNYCIVPYEVISQDHFQSGSYDVFD